MDLTIKQMESLIEALEDGNLKTKIDEIYNTKKEKIVNELTSLLSKFNTVVIQLKSNYETYSGQVIADIDSKTIGQVNTVINTIINPE